MTERLELRDYQERILEETRRELALDPTLLITAPTGAGKCCAPGTPLLLHDGRTTTHEAVLPGDRLMGPDGLPRTVLSTSSGSAEMYEIIPADGGERWRCNAPHMLTLVRGNGELVDVELEQYLNWPQRTQREHRIFRTPVDFAPVGRPAAHPLRVPPYALGAALAAHGENPGPGTAQRASTEELRRARTLLEDETPYPTGESVPREFLTTDRAGRLQLLAGILDSAGELCGREFHYITGSAQLAADVAFVARTTGLNARMEPEPGPGADQDRVAYRIAIRGATSIIPTLRPGHRPPPEREVTGPGVEFTILPAGVGPYCGFMLDGDGRYLLGDTTVTHNTVILAEIMARAYRRGQRAAVLVHRQELVKQAAAAIAAQSGIEPGVVWKSRKEWDEPLLVLAQNTVMAQDIPSHIRDIAILMVDEAHHTVAPSWIRTIKRIRPRLLAGFSATPFRQDREPLSPEPFAKVIRPVTPKELIDRGVLCPAVIESPLIHNRDGDIESVGKASNLPGIYRAAVRYAIAQGRSKILLYVSQTPDATPTEVMDETVALLRRDGITTGGIGQNLSAKRREEEIGAFGASPGASVLVNYQALTEGTDIKVIDCVIVGRHTESESTIIQMIGRGLRIHIIKEDCLVLDYSGRPDMSQIIHYWRLDAPRDNGASQAQAARRLNKAEMEELSVQFPKQMGAFGAARVDYPWFRPFDGSPVLALPSGSGTDGLDRYVAVEPGRDGLWRVTHLTLKDSGPVPLVREQFGQLSEDEAVRAVRSALGEAAGQVARSAPWRVRTPTDRQLQACRQLAKRAKDPFHAPLTAGDASDFIARARFVNRVKPEALR